MGIIGRLDQYASMLAGEFDETTSSSPRISGLSTYFAAEFSENVGIGTTLTANVFPPYDLVYDDFGGTLFGAGQGRYMRQNTDKSVIVYNEIDEVSDFYSRGIVRAGLVLDLDAGIDSSYPGTGTTWTDLSPYSNNGTLTNGPTFSSSNGGSIVFDGVDDYTDCGNNSILLIPNNLSVSIWFRFPTGYGVAGWNSILAKRPSGGSANYGMNYNPTATNLFQWYYLGNGGGVLSVPLTSNFSTNTWTNVCGVFSQNSTTTDAFLYKNGSLLASANLVGNVPSVSGKFTIGCYGDTIFTEFSPITAAQVSIYNRVLTAAEVKQNYDAVKGRFGL